MGIGLETLFHLVYEIVHWCVGWCVPEMFHVEATDEAVKISGSKVKVLGPGRHWYHTMLSVIYHANVRRQTLALDDQLLTTQDHKRVRVGGMLVYKVTDIEKWLIDNEDSAEAIAEMAAHALREVIITSTFAEMQEARSQKRDALTREAQANLGAFGVRVEYLRLTTFAETEAKDIYHCGSLAGGAYAEEEDDE